MNSVKGKGCQSYHHVKWKDNTKIYGNLGSWHSGFINTHYPEAILFGACVSRYSVFEKKLKISMRHIAIEFHGMKRSEKTFFTILNVFFPKSAFFKSFKSGPLERWIFLLLEICRVAYQNIENFIWI
jgi:hypothetical protein